MGNQEMKTSFDQTQNYLSTCLMDQQSRLGTRRISASGSDAVASDGKPLTAFRSNEEWHSLSEEEKTWV
jgi:hypothetical protein